MKKDNFQVIIAGTRNFSNYPLLEKACDFYFQTHKPTAIISGMAKGADTLALEYAKNRNIPIIEMPAEWEIFGKRAGLIRNQQMLEKSDALIAFWDGKSRGTKNMIEIAKKEGKQIRIVSI